MSKSRQSSSSASSSTAPHPPSTAGGGGGWPNGTAHFPEELIAEILLWLPVKALMRFRCVSKPWSSYIDSTKFVKKHLQRSLECNPDYGLIVREKENFYLVDVDSLEGSTAKIVADPLKSLISGAELVGSCNGLICLWKNDKDVLLWNPATNKCKKLPQPTNILLPCKLFGSSVVGFGYDHVNDDHKVVRTSDSQFYGIMVTIYSLKNNSWTRADTITNTIRLYGVFGVFTCGALHWLASRNSFIIVAFDLSVERHREIPFPADVKRTSENEIGLTVIGGCLCMLDHRPSSRINIWLKNNYADENSWTKLLSVEQPHMLSSFKFVWPITYSKTRKDVLLEVDSEKYIWCDLERNEVKNITVHGIPAKFGSLVYTQSLIQLTSKGKQSTGKGKQSNKKKQKQKKKKIDLGKLLSEERERCVRQFKLNLLD